MAGADLYAVAGTKIYIGPATQTKIADFIESELSGLTYVEIDGFQNMGAYGDSAEIIETNLINRGRKIKQKGTTDAGSMENSFAIIPADPGQIALKAAMKTKSNFAFKVEYDDAPSARSTAATVTIASPGVVTWNNHGLLADAAVVFSTTGALPTGLVAGTTYYVKSTGLTANSFQLSATKGGTSIVTSGTQSGVHTITTVPNKSVDYFLALVATAPKSGGEANAINMLNVTLAINSNLVEVVAQG